MKTILASLLIGVSLLCLPVITGCDNGAVSTEPPRDPGPGSFVDGGAGGQGPVTNQRPLSSHRGVPAV